MQRVKLLAVQRKQKLEDEDPARDRGQKVAGRGIGLDDFARRRDRLTSFVPSVIRG